MPYLSRFSFELSGRTLTTTFMLSSGVEGSLPEDFEATISKVSALPILQNQNKIKQYLEVSNMCQCVFQVRI